MSGYSGKSVRPSEALPRCSRPCPSSRRAATCAVRAWWKTANWARANILETPAIVAEPSRFRSVPTHFAPRTGLLAFVRRAVGWLASPRRRPERRPGCDSPPEGTGFEPSVPRRERNESPLGTGTVTEATKVRLEAVAYLPRIEGSTNVPDGRGGSAAKKDQI